MLQFQGLAAEFVDQPVPLEDSDTVFAGEGAAQAAGQFEHLAKRGFRRPFSRRLAFIQHDHGMQVAVGGVRDREDADTGAA